MVKFLLKWLGLTALLMALVFVPAGRVDAPPAWALLGVYSAFLLAFGIVFSGQDPGLVKERSKPGPGVRKATPSMPRRYATGCCRAFGDQGSVIRMPQSPVTSLSAGKTG